MAAGCFNNGLFAIHVLSKMSKAPTHGATVAYGSLKFGAHLRIVLIVHNIVAFRLPPKGIGSGHLSLRLDDPETARETNF